MDPGGSVRAENPSIWIPEEVFIDCKPCQSPNPMEKLLKSTFSPKTNILNSRIFPWDGPNMESPLRAQNRHGQVFDGMRGFTNFTYSYCRCNRSHQASNVHSLLLRKILPPCQHLLARRFLQQRQEACRHPNGLSPFASNQLPAFTYTYKGNKKKTIRPQVLAAFTLGPLDSSDELRLAARFQTTTISLFRSTGDNFEACVCLQCLSYVVCSILCDPFLRSFFGCLLFMVRKSKRNKSWIHLRYYVVLCVCVCAFGPYLAIRLQRKSMAAVQIGRTVDVLLLDQ